IEGRGELPGATSAVMEMCIDNPREGFSNIFDTHPPVGARVAALVKFAGGHDPGPLALPAPSEAQADESDDADQPTHAAPWGGSPCGAGRGGGRPAAPGQRRAVRAERAAGRARLPAVGRRRARPLGTAPEIAGTLSLSASDPSGPRRLRVG